MTAPGPPASVLVVDDDADIRDTIALILRGEGYDVRTAANGREALDALGARRAQLVLLDLMMPVMSGHEFRARQRADAALAEVPVVVISGDGRVQDKAAALGVAGCLLKPIELETLIDTVRRHVGSV